MVGLKYDGEETKIELRDATVAAFGSEKGAKRVRLDGGTLVCSAAPQKKPFEIKTRHATARVVGTRFSLGVTEAESRLGVQEGKVELLQGEKILLVSAGEAATASDDEMGIDGRFVAAGGTVTDYVLNGINWRTHVFATAGITSLTVLARGSVEVYAWGGGGGYSGEGDYPNSFGLGGGGGAANGSVTMTPGVYAIVVGGGGVRQPYYRGNAGSPVPGGGGLAAATGGSGQGGGYSGIFRTSVAQANALLIAGGGGGSGYFNPEHVAFAVLTAGSGATPGDSGNPLRGSAGCGGDLSRPGSNGIVVVRYSISGNSTGQDGR
jgi:hypothetical protein